MGRHARLFVLAAMLLGGGWGGCQSQQDGGAPLDRSILFRSLMSSNKNGISCAAEFLALNGGPKWEPPSPPDTDAQWKSAGRERASWLSRQPPDDIARLDQGFSGYRATWSPRYSVGDLK